MKDRADHLRELELGDNATPGEIRQAYRDLARVWHPDRFANDPRMQVKASDKLRRVIEAYEFLQAHPSAGERPHRAARRRGEGQPRRSSPPPASNRRDEVSQALANLQQRARLLDQRVKASDRRALADWEPRAWAGIGLGMALPAALFFVATETFLAAGTLLWFVFGGSSASLLVLAIYRFMRIRREADDAIRAVGSADVTCGRCGRGVIGSVSPASVEQALGRADWALAHLRCPHCRRGLV